PLVLFTLSFVLCEFIYFYILVCFIFFFFFFQAEDGIRDGHVTGVQTCALPIYNLPVCVVVFNNNGVYRGTDVNPTGGPDVAPTVFVKGARYDKLMEAFGGVGVHATTPAELRKAMEESIRSRKPTLINAVIDESAGTESGRIT